MGSITLHSLNQVGNEIGTALILVLHFAPRSLGFFLIGGNGVETASRKQRHKHRKTQSNENTANRCWE